MMVTAAGGATVAVVDADTVGELVTESEGVGELELVGDFVGLGLLEVDEPNGVTALIHRDLRPYCLRNVTALAVADVPAAATALRVITAPPGVRSTTLMATMFFSLKKSATCC